MRIVGIVHGFVSTIAFVGCIAGQELATSDTETAVSVDGNAQVCPDPRDCPSPGEAPPVEAQVCPDPKDCPSPGSALLRAKARVCTDPKGCPQP